MLDMPQNILMILTSLNDCTYQVSSPYKVFNLLVMANVSEKNTHDLWAGVHPPLGMPLKPPLTHLKIFNQGRLR